MDYWERFQQSSTKDNTSKLTTPRVSTSVCFLMKRDRDGEIQRLYFHFKTWWWNVVGVKKVKECRGEMMMMIRKSPSDECNPWWWEKQETQIEITATKMQCVEKLILEGKRICHELSLMRHFTSRLKVPNSLFWIAKWNYRWGTNTHFDDVWLLQQFTCNQQKIRVEKSKSIIRFAVQFFPVIILSWVSYLTWLLSVSIPLWRLS